jgi:hypothetical protein
MPTPPPEKPECRKQAKAFHVIRSQPATIPVTITGGASCAHSYVQDNVQFTRGSITAHPRHGKFSQTGSFAFLYQPEPGFKGADHYAVRICGRSRNGSGCSVLTYQVTIR